MSLYWIDTGYACGGAVTNNKGMIVDVPPIFKWMRNKNIKDVLKWGRIKRYKKLNDTVENK